MRIVTNTYSLYMHANGIRKVLLLGATLTCCQYRMKREARDGAYFEIKPYVVNVPGSVNA